MCHPVTVTNTDDSVEVIDFNDTESASFFCHTEVMWPDCKRVECPSLNITLEGRVQ